MVDAVRVSKERVDRLEKVIEEFVSNWSLAPVVRSLQALRGVDLIVAVTFATEIGDVSRFESPRQLMGYLGLVPGERSTGETTKRGGITKANDVRLFFDDPGGGDVHLDTHETTDLDHGRSETRRHTVCHDVGWIVSDRRYPAEPRFPGIKAIAMVEATVGRGDKTSVQRRYFLSSLPLDAALFARAVRAHWGIENRLHWVLDVIFHDDLMRLRTANGPQNMATIKHMAMNLIRGASGKDSLKTRRKAAAWNHEYLRAIVTQTA